MVGTELIAAERKRQIEVEGWTEQHDDNQRRGVIAMAAAWYACPPGCRDRLEWLWPWDDEYRKPTPDNRVRELVKAGALIAAEIDRLQRPVSDP